MFKNISISKSQILLLVAFHIFIIAISNWLVQFPQKAFGIDYNWAMFTFPFVIIATDLTIRLSNQTNARLIISIAYIPAILISTFLADWRIGFASGTAYLLSQLLDVFVFQKIREKTTVWIAAPVIATFISNILDTYTFYGVAFAGSSDIFMAQNWVHIATVDLAFKMIFSFMVVLPFYGILLNYALKRMQPQ